MPLYASNFTANSLSGFVRVSGGTANIRLIVEPIAFEGTKQFVLKLRKDSITGAIIATTGNITINDTSSITSITANVASVSEGNLVSFTLVTANVPNNANVYYSLLNVAGNVNASDFLNNGVNANTGTITIVNNTATFALRANSDLSIIDEDGETFKLQLRTNSITGNIVYTTSNVAIVDLSSNLPAPNGQAEYTVAGTYSWIAPIRVSNVSVVAIGGGGGGFVGIGPTVQTYGGGGGGLGWRNDITVISGNPYTVVVGIGGTKGSHTAPTATSLGWGGAGGTSYFIDTGTVYGGGGGGGSVPGGASGTQYGSIGGYGGTGGGNGGLGGGFAGYGGQSGGGGAGGYAGNGGRGGTGGAPNPGAPTPTPSGPINQTGQAGGGGGGGGGGGVFATTAGAKGGVGGGTGLQGQGSPGPGGGGAGSGGSGQFYGGGGNGGSSGHPSFGPAAPDPGITAGSQGAVRIIWGPNRQFPNTLTTDLF